MIDLQRAIKQLETGKDINLVRDSLSLHFQELDYKAWYKTQSDAYYALYPQTRYMTPEERIANDTDGNGNTIVREAGYVYPEVTIDYSNDETFITLNEYVNETIVVTPYKPEVPATYDADGIELTPYVPAIQEVTQRVREFTPKANYDVEIDSYLATYKEYKQRHLDYLANTDWYVTRFTETGVAIPQTVLDARANARLELNKVV